MTSQSVRVAGFTRQDLIPALKDSPRWARIWRVVTSRLQDARQQRGLVRIIHGERSEAGRNSIPLPRKAVLTVSHIDQAGVVLARGFISRDQAGAPVKRPTCCNSGLLDRGREGDRVAWRSNLDALDTWGGIDILLHSAAGGLNGIPTRTLGRQFHSQACSPRSCLP